MSTTKIVQLFVNNSLKEAEEWHAVTARAIREKLFHEKHGMFDYLDARENKLADISAASGFMPLFCGAASREQVSALSDYLNSRSFCALHQGNCYTIPNYEVKKEAFDRQNYLRGPVWININWRLMNGLRRYGYLQKADAVAKDILQLHVRFGFHEYYESFNKMNSHLGFTQTCQCGYNSRTLMCFTKKRRFS